MLSVHIPHSMPELCALETRSCKTAVLRNAHHSKIAKLGKVSGCLDKALWWWIQSIRFCGEVVERL